MKSYAAALQKLINALLEGYCSREDLVRITGFSPKIVSQYLNSLQRSGLLISSPVRFHIIEQDEKALGEAVVAVRLPERGDLEAVDAAEARASMARTARELMPQALDIRDSQGVHAAADFMEEKGFSREISIIALVGGARASSEYGIPTNDRGA